MTVILTVLGAVVMGWALITLSAMIVLPVLAMSMGLGWRFGWEAWKEFRRDVSPFGLSFWQGRAK